MGAHREGLQLVNFRIEEEDYERFKELAKRNGLTMTGLVRMALIRIEKELEPTRRIPVSKRVAAPRKARRAAGGEG